MQLHASEQSRYIVQEASLAGRNFVRFNDRNGDGLVDMHEYEVGPPSKGGAAFEVYVLGDSSQWQSSGQRSLRNLKPNCTSYVHMDEEQA